MDRLQSATESLQRFPAVAQAILWLEWQVKRGRASYADAPPCFHLPLALCAPLFGLAVDRGELVLAVRDDPTTRWFYDMPWISGVRVDMTRNELVFVCAELSLPPEVVALQVSPHTQRFGVGVGVAPQLLDLVLKKGRLSIGKIGVVDQKPVLLESRGSRRVQLAR